MSERDPVLRRVERNAVAFCLLAAAVALVVRGGRPDAALGVLGGGVLAGASYWAIKRSIDALAALVCRTAGTAGTADGPPADGPPADGPPAEAPGVAWPVVQLAGRYALLGFLAYVMIARLRLHPVGLLAGVSSLVAAATLEAIRYVAPSSTGRAN